MNQKLLSFLHLWVFSTLLAIPVYAQDQLVFKTTYDVSWKGWKCGTMQSELTYLKETDNYLYRQHLESHIFFYPFSQIEESYFALQNGHISCQQYSINRSGVEGPSYTVDFKEDHIHVRFKDSDEERCYELQKHPVYDKLITQMVLIRSVLQNKLEGERVICFIDPKGIHHRVYDLVHHPEKGMVFESNYGVKSSSFVLDPNRRYLPTLFEQYRHGNLIFTGSLTSAVFGPGWDLFFQ